MRPVILEATGGVDSGLSAPAPMNYIQMDFKIGFGCVVDGTATYNVEHTFDDPKDYADADAYNSGATWFTHETVAAETANQDGNYAYNIRALRLNVTAGAGTVTGTFLQGD